MRYPRASTEPLEIIRVNECEADVGLATTRFQALWNEIDRLNVLLAEAIAINGELRSYWKASGCASS